MLLGMDHGFKLFAVGSLIFHGSLGYDLPSVEVESTKWMLTP